MSQQFRDAFFQSGLFQMTFVICLSVFPIILVVILSECIYVVLNQGSYVSKRRKYAKWLFLKLIGRINALNGAEMQETLIEDIIKVLGQVQNEILTFKDESGKFLSTTIVDYSSDVHKWFRIDQEERSKLDLSRFVLKYKNFYAF